MPDITNVDTLEMSLAYLTGIGCRLDPLLHDRLQALFTSLGPSLKNQNEVEATFYARINEKLDLNKGTRSQLYGDLSKKGYTFNFPSKKLINQAIDRNAPELLHHRLVALKVPESLAADVCSRLLPADTAATKTAIIGETTKPSKLRSNSARMVAEEVFHSCLGALVWSLWDEEVLYQHFGGGGRGTTAAQYLEFLQDLHPQLFNRDRNLALRFVSPSPSEDRESRRLDASRWMRDAYYGLGNHGFVALVVDAEHAPAAAWQYINDATLYGERFIETPLKQMFFRSKEVEAETLGHIEGEIDTKAARFDLLSEGFTYRDVFVLTGNEGTVVRLVLVMQKNERDETRIPCPACRGEEIEGNSYPSFGVRSWECRNPLCPGRSIYNRGYRFQFRSSVQQAAIEDPRNLIDAESISRWRRDVLPFVSDNEILSTLVKHYSLNGDGVSVEGTYQSERAMDALGRRQAAPLPSSDSPVGFWDGPYFARFEEAPKAQSDREDCVPQEGRMCPPHREVVRGDSQLVLASKEPRWVSRAITSPPYFNAREYSQWPNFYTYLFDMRQNAKEVFRALKPGGLYVFNVFDYFDNERTVNFSLMGKKRLTLGAHIAAEFERLGFELLAVVPWDKGEIQGKRGFNGGNDSPYYQSPFNCWEHILVFRKPGAATEDSFRLGLPMEKMERVLAAQPVFKMVRGVNSYGHTAPFPTALPDYFLDGLGTEDTVLDPYAGSATTGVACRRKGIGYFMIERDPVYAALAQRKLAEADSTLFDTGKYGQLDQKILSGAIS
ncbi:DNA-methyltransferase [Arthrobacter sp. TE12232]